MTFPIYYDSSEAGAPSLTNAAGCIPEILRACGANGFNSKSVSNIVVSSGVAVATAAAHGYTATAGKRLLVSGSAEAGLNGSVQPTAVTTNTFTYEAPGVADGTYTGSISAKRAPFGLTEAFPGTNKSIFARSSPEAYGFYFRVDDTNTGDASATDARIVGAEVASDVDTYSDVFPTAAQKLGGMYINKGANSTTPKKWFVVGHGRFFYLATQLSSSDEMALAYFGDINTHRAADPYGVMNGFSTSVHNGGATSGTRASYCSPVANLSLALGSPTAARDSTGLYKSTYQGLVGPCYGEIGAQGEALATSVVFHRPIYLGELRQADSVQVIRGEVPGLAAPLATRPFSNGQIVTDTDGLVYLSVRQRSSLGQGNVLISLNDDWY